ncbi:CGL100 [Auxenochlorella protothecoides x Auxenochlorella symbiontica]
MQLLSPLPSHVLHKALGVRPRLHYKQGGTTALREGEAPTAPATNDGNTQRTPPNGFSSSQEPRRRSAAEGGAASHSNFPSRPDVLSAVASTTLVLALTGQALRMVAPIASPAVWLGHADALQHYLSQGVSSPSLALDAGVVAGVSAARWCLMALVSGFKASSNASNAQALSACSPLDVVWVGAIPGAAEEWCFRGGLLPAISPDWRGAAVTAIVFGLLHLLDRRRTPVSAAWATGVGAAYGALYLHTGNVADAALAHALSNVVSGLGYKLGGTQAPDTPS